ncbi:MAG: hypothetical protein ACOY90_23255 [Candidatus Zhuqueibacterota bacterium]
MDIIRLRFKQLGILEIKNFNSRESSLRQRVTGTIHPVEENSYQ